MVAVDQIEELIAPSVEAMGYDLIRVRYGGDPYSRHKSWNSNPDFTQSPEDAEYFK